MLTKNNANAPYYNDIPYYNFALSVVLSPLISPTHTAHKQCRHHRDYVDQYICSNINQLLFIQARWCIYLLDIHFFSRECVPSVLYLMNMWGVVVYLACHRSVSAPITNSAALCLPLKHTLTFNWNFKILSYSPSLLHTWTKKLKVYKYMPMQLQTRTFLLIVRHFRGKCHV